MTTCECGCGQQSTREFLPGHDQKLRTALERRLGGILHLRALVQAAEAHVDGALTESELSRRVRALLATVGRGAN